MTSSLLLLVAPFLAGAVFFLVGALVTAGVLGIDRTGLHAGALTARWAGSLLGILAMTVLVGLGLADFPSYGPFGYGAIAAFGPAVGGIVLVLAIAMGERTLPASPSDVRRASLVQRTAGAVIPRSAVAIAAIVAGVLLVLSVVSFAIADGGRAYTTERVLVTGELIRSSFTPFPGSHYSFPMWAGLLVLIAVAVVVLRQIVRRRPSDDVHDILLRRRSSTSVLGAMVLAAALCTLPVASLLTVRLLSSDGLARTTSLEQVGIAIGAAGSAVGLIALPAGLVMVVFPEVLARRSPRRSSGVVVEAGPDVVEGVGR